MQQAKFDKEMKKQQMQQLEARINKLQLEQDKAKKRIQDAKAQQEFVASIKSDKQRQLDIKLKHQQEMLIREEENRKKIHEDKMK